MRRIICLLMCLMFLPVMAATAESTAALSVSAPAQTIRPGKAFLLSFTVPQDGLCDLALEDAQGETVLEIVTGFDARAGLNQMWWNGTNGGQSAPEGVYQLVVRQDGAEASAAVVIGSFAPFITGITPVKDIQSMLMTVELYASVDGMLTMGLWVDNDWLMLENYQVTAGPNTVHWDAANMAEGTRALTLTLTDATGYSSNEEHVAVSPADFGVVFVTPTPLPTDAPTPEMIPAETAMPAETELPDGTQPTEAVATPLPTLIVEAVELTAPPVATPTPMPAPEVTFIPSYGSPYAFDEAADVSFWNTEMDITDEESVWTMLTAPITVIKGDQKTQAKIYLEPDEDSRAVGVVTRATQGVRVIETLDNGWSLIECYSSSFHDNTVDAWNMLVQGYVKSSTLETKTVDEKYGLIVDKLTQRLYVFADGKLFTTLLISTGVANERQPYNETRSGEFIFGSAVGGFWSDNMYCPSALRFNDGDLLHEVPYVQRSEGGTKIYSNTEPYLGQRASHGCIRVQRKRSPEGVNMTWLWNNRKHLGRIVIWEDWQGRQVAYPADDTVLYYNAAGGSYYHRAETCYSAKNSVTFTPFTYQELDSGEFADLDYCPYCAPEMRRSEIDKINEVHAWGGDHDPVLTQARQKYLDSIEE